MQYRRGWSNRPRFLSRIKEYEEAFVGSGNKMMPLSEKDRRIKELEAELRETRRANDILKEALGFFAQSRKK